MQAQPRHTFEPAKNKDFFPTLRKRVNAYFKENNISKYATTETKVKAVIMFAAYLIPYAFILSGMFTTAGAIILLYVLMGLGKAGIGLNIMHDSNHGTFFKKKKLNKLMQLSMNAIGGSDIAWQYQHNYLHHSFTNIAGSDMDIETTVLMRNSPLQKWRAFHRFQHIYSWLLYGLGTFSRVLFRDFLLLPMAYKDGYIKTKQEYRREMFKIITSKVIYFSAMLLLPYLLLPVSFGVIFLAFFVMHFVTGFILSLIFVCAHVMPTSDFISPEQSGKVDENWAVHQMRTTTNFAQHKRIFSWFIGGLNYQVEHHLFPNMSHAHYRPISKIVKQTADEFGVPYHTYPSFIGAVALHGKMLHKFSKKSTSGEMRGAEPVVSNPLL